MEKKKVISFADRYSFPPFWEGKKPVWHGEEGLKTSLLTYEEFVDTIINFSRGIHQKLKLQIVKPIITVLPENIMTVLNDYTDIRSTIYNEYNASDENYRKYLFHKMKLHKLESFNEELNNIWKLENNLATKYWDRRLILPNRGWNN